MAFDANGNILRTTYKRKAVFIRSRVAENQSKWCRAPWDLVEVLDGDTGVIVTRRELRYSRVPLNGDDVFDAYDEVILTDTVQGDPSAISY